MRRLDSEFQRELPSGGSHGDLLSRPFSRLNGCPLSQGNLKHTPEQVIRKLAEGEKLLNQGNDIAEVCRQLEITQAPNHPSSMSTSFRR